jgi:hypothetical protein
MDYLRGQLEDFKQLQEGLNVKQPVYFSWEFNKKIDFNVKNKI